jgi:nitroimidazol reductase NimA-like FMN-containing flavoprotein (pyridoxamine 5'-phosphate oxidase superfamily)
MCSDDGFGFRELGRQECLRLLTCAPVGRLVHTRHALPAVLPVRFCLDTDSAVVLRTPPGSDLVRALDGVVVAFEADDLDRAATTAAHDARRGWSVQITGRAAVVTSPAERARLARSGPRSWRGPPQDADDVFVRIEAELVSGRELTAGRGAGIVP